MMGEWSDKWNSRIRDAEVRMCEQGLGWEARNRLRGEFDATQDGVAGEEFGVRVARPDAPEARV